MSTIGYDGSNQVMMVPKLKVRVYDDPCLRAKSDPVKEIGPGERMLIRAMLEAMHEQKGIGLAAPQVGVNRQIFVADIGEGPIAVINPQIVKSSGAVVMEEGCLSLPGIHVNVKRARKILVKYVNEQGQKIEREFTELLARVFQHESDHLRGKLIIDYVDRKEKEILKPLLDELTARPKVSSPKSKK